MVQLQLEGWGLGLQLTVKSTDLPSAPGNFGPGGARAERVFLTAPVVNHGMSLLQTIRWERYTYSACI